jgi:hypothetical protein
MKPIELHPEAEDELDEAAAHYEAQREGLGARLIEAVDRVLSLEEGEVDQDWEAAWAAEIDARMDALEQERTTATDWRQAMASLRAAVKARRSA